MKEKNDALITIALESIKLSDKRRPNKNEKCLKKIQINHWDFFKLHNLKKISGFPKNCKR